MQLQKLSNINTAQKSKMNQIEMYKLQTSLVQFKDQKKLKTYLIVRIKLSVNEHALKGLKYKQRLNFWTCLKYDFL